MSDSFERGSLGGGCIDRSSRFEPRLRRQRVINFQNLAVIPGKSTTDGREDVNTDAERTPLGK